MRLPRYCGPTLNVQSQQLSYPRSLSAHRPHEVLQIAEDTRRAHFDSLSEHFGHVLYLGASRLQKYSD